MCPEEAVKQQEKKNTFVLRVRKGAISPPKKPRRTAQRPRRVWVAWGVSLKSVLWVESCYPLPSPGGINGLFLGAASVAPHTAHSDLKPQRRCPRRLGCRAPAKQRKVRSVSLMLLTTVGWLHPLRVSCLISERAHPNNFPGFWLHTWEHYNGLAPK